MSSNIPGIPDKVWLCGPRVLIAPGDTQVGMWTTNTPTSGSADPVLAATPARECAERMVEALRWYAVQVAGCRKVTSEGEAARQALDRDGGSLARSILDEIDAAPPKDPEFLVSPPDS